MRNPFSCAATGDYGSSPQASGGRFRNATPKPTKAPASSARIMWDFFFNKPANTTPPAPVPVHPLTREALRLAPDRSLYRLGHSTCCCGCAAAGG